MQLASYFALASARVSGEGMSLILLVFLLCCLGAGVYLVQTRMKPTLIRTILIVVLSVVAVILALQYFGLWDELKSL